MTAKPIFNPLAPDTSLGPMAHRDREPPPRRRLRRTHTDDRHDEGTNIVKRPFRTPSGSQEWLVPTLLIMLSAVPVAAGTVRLVQLAGGAQITPDNARFFATPVPVVLHIISVTLYCVLGAFQFAPGFRRRKPNWHRAAGRILVPCGLVAALSGLWLTQVYPPVDGDGPILYGIRLLVGSAMVLFICLGVAAIRQRDIPRHRAWMMRGYALGLGAGTQALTHLPWFLFPAIQGELTRALFMGAGWVINLVVAEWIIRGRPTDQIRAAAAPRLAAS